ncbi:MAG: HlyD family secretion protein [Novosphingobium sp.]|nr:HlyD family secretion protein [Novosphingobium sp.]
MAESDPVFDAPLRQATAIHVPPSGRGKALRRVALLACIPLLLIGGAVFYYLQGLHTVSTDNAYVRQDKIAVAPLVNGRIVGVAVKENQTVRPGDLLFRIDPEPYRIAIAQADAQIAAAQAHIVGLQTDLSTTNVDIEGGRRDVAFYEKEYQRQSELMGRGFNTRSHLDQAQHDLDDARNKLASAEATESKARAALATGSIAPGVNPALLEAQVQKRKAELDLSHTVVRAPISGKVSQASKLLPGQLALTGMSTLTIVRSEQSWVEANFKETDLAEMHVGQPAILTFDAYPELKLHGHVASLGAGTGSEFSILPAQNANGNWVKVTQRVPVRIAIDDSSPRPLIAGLSAKVTIDTHR